MAATHPFYPTTDLATKLIPALAPMTLDKEKEVRDHVFKTLHLFLDKLERISEDPVAAQEQEKAEGQCTVCMICEFILHYHYQYYLHSSSVSKYM